MITYNRHNLCHISYEKNIFRSQISLNSKALCRMYNNLRSNSLAYEDRKARKDAKQNSNLESPYLEYEVEVTNKKRRLHCPGARRMRRSAFAAPRRTRQNQCEDGPWENIVQVNKNLRTKM